MKIAMVSEHANPLAAPGSVDSGGQNVHVAALAKALAARGHKVTVYTRRDNTQTPTRVRMGVGVEVVHLSAGPAERVPKDELLPYMHALAEELAQAWNNDTPDIVHGHFWMSGLASLEGARLMSSSVSKPAIVQTFHALGSVKRRHQGVLDTSPAQRASLEPIVGSQVDAVIATCDDEVGELLALGVPGKQIEVAPCGVDLAAFPQDGPVEQRGASFRVLSIGRLVPRKGVDLVIRALGILAARGMTDIELEVVGDGEVAGEQDPERMRLAELAAQLNVLGQVHFRGSVSREEIPKLLRSGDVVVCTPWYEPFGIVPLESMACGVPVIAAAVGGLRDSIVDRVTGLHVPPHDPAAIAEALHELLEDETLRRAYGSAGRARVEELYTWDGVAQRTEEIYERVHARTARTNLPMKEAV